MSCHAEAAAEKLPPSALMFVVSYCNSVVSLNMQQAVPANRSTAVLSKMTAVRRDILLNRCCEIQFPTLVEPQAPLRSA